ncbi:PAS domain S-box-containing protein [Algoriphagus sp. 4150]|uniref:PAS domain-containing protein n=1 Tax=Algoriphagus sp. 4150 TaxID=2817756 RepID=UPI00285CA96F|nr:PAS domain-containing protein [Algoriphagus sp. 4150]MDR7129419.1 PAS domain S-box-containing protein [Algoriphagus sp. 4150]
MKNNSEQLLSFLKSMGGIVWEADSMMRLFNFIGDPNQHILGFPQETWTDTPGFWESRIHPDDIGVVSEYRNLNDSPGKIHSFEYRMISADDNIKWVKDTVSFITERDVQPFLCGIRTETTAFRRLIALEQLEKNVFRLNMNNSLHELLLCYLAGLEELFPMMQCSILKIKNGRLHDGISPSLPGAYMASLENVQIGENVGSCGTAAALKRQIIVTDISTDFKWIGYRELALMHGLMACWSNPVIGTEGEVIATLAMYYRQPKSPTEDELRVMERATALLQVILENRQNTEIIIEKNLLMLQSQELAHFGNWNWDIEHNIVTWSPALYAIYGLNPNEFKATFEGYLELLHPDDRTRVKEIIENVLSTGEDTDFEERIVRPDGEVRYLRSWAKRKSDPNGEILGMIGACLDNTEKVSRIMAIEEQNQQFREIAWLQSHIIRAPLARIMGLIDLIKNTSVEELSQSKLLDYLLTSANELDDQIRIITQKTELKDGTEI